MDYSLTRFYDEANKCWQVKLCGEVDIFRSEEMKQFLVGLTEEKKADLVIDCSSLEYIDSTALGALVSVLKSVKAYGGKVSMENVRPNLLKLFKITNLDKVFQINARSGADTETENKA